MAAAAILAVLSGSLVTKAQGVVTAEQSRQIDALFAKWDHSDSPGCTLTVRRFAVGGICADSSVNLYQDDTAPRMAPFFASSSNFRIAFPRRFMPSSASSDGWLTKFKRKK